MSLMDNFKDWGKAQFLDVVQWLDDSNDIMAWRFPFRGQEIQNGGKLVVRPSQAAVFMDEGRFGDVFVQPNTYTLNTQNLPILATLKGWKYGFESPFKSDVVFINTKLFNDLGWGTPNPVMMRDPDFGMVRIKAHGIYSVQVPEDPEAIKTFIKQLVGTNGQYTIDDCQNQLRKTISSKLADTLAELKMGALDLNMKIDEVGDAVKEKLQAEFLTMGVKLAKLVVEPFTLPEEVEAMMDKRTSVGMMAPVMGAYTQMQVADSMPIAAANEGGIAGLGMGAGLGFGMGGMMAGQMAQAAQGYQQPMPVGTPQMAAQAAPAAPAKSLKEELSELKDLFDSQLITQAEFDAQRAAIMKKHGMGS
ncbi:MAG: SPFH domain-containing protein [Holophagaceae bacterium]